MSDEEKVVRATLLKTKEKQKELLQWIETLIEKNRPVKSTERMRFLSLTADALLGEGSKIETTTEHLDPFDGVDWKADGPRSSIKIENFSDVIRYMVYENRKEINGEPISKLWKKVRACVLRVAPYALQTAIRSSAERIPQTKRKPDRV